MLAPAVALATALLVVSWPPARADAASSRARGDAATPLDGTVRFSGEVRRGQRFARSLPGGLRFALEPYPGPGEGAWRIGVFAGADTARNLATIATPPYHGPNPTVIEAWHFRKNLRGEQVNAPREERGFTFLANPGDYDAYRRALESVLWPMGSVDSAQAAMDATPVREGTLTIRGMEFGRLESGGAPYFEWLRFDVELKPRSAVQP